MSVILITGANRGIGLCILQRLVQAFPNNKYILACRDLARGNEARVSLKSEAVDVLQMDVSSQESITKAIEMVRQKYGALDVLINNAGVAEGWHKTFEVNVFAPYWIFEAAMDLLVKSKEPRVINVSSGRASLTRSSDPASPPTRLVSYSVSKVALNGLGVEMAKLMSTGRVWNVNPGHCKTAFNGYTGKRDPLEGAAVVEVLLKRDQAGDAMESGFWEEEDGELRRVPW